MSLPCITSKGQIIQIVVPIIALGFTVHNAWTDIMASNYFSGGMIVFYLLVMAVVIAFGRMVAAFREHAATVKALSESGGNSSSESEDQPQIIILQRKVLELESQLNRQRIGAEHERQEAIRKAHYLTTKAPQLFVKFVRLPQSYETAEFSSDNGRAVNISVGSLTINSTYSCETIPSSVPSVPEGKTEVVKFSVIDDFKHYKLALLEMARSVGNADISVTVNYEDTSTVKLSRTFSITRHADDTVEWKPGPVRIRE